MTPNAPNVQRIGLLDADDTRLMQISREGVLSLNLPEMQTIQAYFKRLGRNPTDVELETLAQTWSEHCVHKTFRGVIEYKEGGNSEIIDNLLKQTIMRVTSELDKPWCVSVFKDNAGIVEFDEQYNLTFKVETHNHPSALEPYGGAGTGIGGVIRDTLGAGLGARPIVNTDIFCFGMPDMPYEDVPRGSLHPKRIFKGVVAGVRDYGNRMGIPTANGAIYFDPRYTANPLVYCGSLGLIPVDRCEKSVEPGDKIVVAGGRTGRDGIHGATFSSLELDETSQDLGSAVQIGNPIVEKKVTDTLLQARDRNLYRNVTDCGAGGLSSAVGEMGEPVGARVHLETVPLKYTGLTPWEVWLSEAQERMVFAVPPENLDELLAIFEAEDVEATVIGEFTDTHKLQVYYDDDLLAEVDMDFLHDGVPRITREATWEPPLHPEPDFPCPDDLGPVLLQLLAAPNIASKEWVIRQYDHEVQGASVLKPLQGVENDGPGDAAVITPVFGSKRGVAIANGLNPKYSDVDPYWMAASGIDEALRNIIAVGGTLEKTAILDNFSWGNPDKPDRLGGFVRAAKACYDIARVYGTPFVSGKDSFNNEYRDSVTGEQVAIPGTLLISAISVIDDVTKVVSMDVKRAGNRVYIVGRTYDELGASHYHELQDAIGNQVPIVRAEEAKAAMTALTDAIAGGLVAACHDCSEGGIGVAAAEMAFAGGLGMTLSLANVPVADGLTRDDLILFSESNSRFLVEVNPADAQAFEQCLTEAACACIGEVTAAQTLVVSGLDGTEVLNLETPTCKASWQKTLDW